MRDSIVIFLKGFLMGSADVVPGVSGGTMALITGIYERLISAIRSINFNFVSAYIKGDREGRKESLRSIDIGFLVPLILGIFCAVLVGARVLHHVLEEYPGPTYAFFFGLILASAGFVSKYVERIDATHILLGAIAFVLVFLISDMEEVTSNHTLPAIFVAGAIAICAMILPGISGSLILLILGQYDYMLTALNEWDMKVLITFGVGAVTGLLLFSRLLHWLLEHYKSVTMAFLFGSMLGALQLPGEMIHENIDYSSMTSVLAIVIAAVVGFALVLILQSKSEQIERRLGLDEEEP